MIQSARMMNDRVTKNGWPVFAVLVVCALIAGCRQLRLPAIDPSGNRIFLPPPNSTRLAGASRSGGLLPSPAFSTPDAPPPCESPAAVDPQVFPVLAIAPGGASSIVVSQESVVAPVGSEVILLAGLRQADGSLATGQPLQWTISQESVGHFVEVGDGGRGPVGRLLGRKSPQLTNKLASGTTALRQELITRGTPSPNDDVIVQPGQGWVRLASPIAGTTVLTITAPEAAGWNQQHQIVTVHWTDIRAVFPLSQVVKAGQPHSLTTSVTRLSDGTPLAGWTVRYQLVGTGGSVLFEPGKTNSVDVTTNEAGQAAATLVPQTDQHATANVQIQVIRPPSAAGQAAQMAAAQGQCTVTWSVPGLAVRVSGAETVGIDSVITYRVEVSNPGSMAVRDIVISDEISAGLEVVNSQPAGTPFGNRLEWRITELPPNSASVIEVRCRAKEEGTQEYCITATGGGLKAEACQQTQVAVPAIGLVMRGPDRVAIGQKAVFEVEITNQGDVPLDNVLLVDEFDIGLKHDSGTPSPIKKPLDDPILPGKTAFIKMIFDAVRAGTWSHTLTITADGGHRAQAKSVVTVEAPRVETRPGIQAQITGTPEQTVGGQAVYSMEVRNVGNVPLTNVLVYFTFSPSLTPVKATPGHEWHQGGLLWRTRIPQLAPGNSDIVGVRCQCLRANPAANVKVFVSSGENVADSATTQTQIDAAKVVEPPKQNGLDVDPPVTGQLSLTVVDLDDSIQIGQETTYVVTLKNDRNATDANVFLSFQIPAGMEFVRLRHELEVKRTVSQDGRLIEFGPIKMLREREAYPAFRLTLKGTRTGTFEFRVKVKSQRTPEGIEAVEDTTVVE